MKRQPPCTVPALDAVKMSADVASGELFRCVLSRLVGDKQVRGRVQVQVSMPQHCWTLDLNAERHRLEPCGGDEAVAVLRISEADLIAVVLGQELPADLYQRGRLRVDGDTLLVRKMMTALYAMACSKSEDS